MSANVDDYYHKVAASISSNLAKIGDLYSAKSDIAFPRFLLSSHAEGPGERESDVSPLYHVCKLASTLAEAAGMRDVLEVVAARVAGLVGAQAMAVVAHDHGRLHVIGYTGYPETVALPSPAGEVFDGYVRSAGPPMFLESPAAAVEAQLGQFAQNMEAHALLPLISSGQRVGTLLLGFRSPRVFSSEERAVLVTMAGMIAQSMERARLFDATQALGKELQQGLLPCTLPHIAGLDMAVRYYPAAPGSDVGGDWYDVLVLPDDRIGLVIGDVEGHSMTSAALMGQIRSAVRAYAAEGHGPADVLDRTNRLLSDLGADLFAACCCVWIDGDDGTAEIASAGHHGPLLCIPDRSGVMTPCKLPGPPLGVAPDTVYRSTEVALPAGTVLALFTDGMVHSHSLELGRGVQTVSDILSEVRKHPLESMADRLITIAGDVSHREDDAALLLVRHSGFPSPTTRVRRMFVQRHDLRAVQDVRRFVRASLSDWDRAALTDEAELMVTELVTNALIHADSEVDVRLREFTERIHIEVRDSDPRPPLPAPITLADEVDSESEHGRGLLIVDALASAWGNSPRGRGKSVWFEI
ncbi:SpoIIE family protein phosphatase [Streptomyces sp. NPDC059627]